MTGLNESKLHHFGSPNFSPFDSFVACPRILASWSKGVLDARETRAREEGQVVDPENELSPPEEAVAVKATVDLPLLLALAGASSPPTLCAERPVLIARVLFRRAPRGCARQNAKVSVNGERSHYITYYERTGAWRQEAGASVAQFLRVAALQVRNGATSGNQRLWNFPKISLR